MSETSDSSFHRDGGRSSVPRAVIHKRILDAAESDPDASMDELAAEVPGASTTLVEKVLEEYGDPAEGDAVDPPGESTEATPEDRKETEVDPEEDERAAVDSEGHKSAVADAEDDETGAAVDDHERSASDDEPPATNTEDRATVTRTDTAEGTPSGAPTTPMNEHDSHQATSTETDSAELTEKQRKTLRTIAAHPDATQAEIGDVLGVSGATICQRLQSIDGCAWDTRHEFVNAMIENGELRPDEGDDAGETADSDESDGADGESLDRDDDGERLTDGTGEADRPMEPITRRLDALADRMETIEQRLDGETETTGSTTAFSDPELVHKVVHACLASDRISEEEELEIIRELISGDEIPDERQ